ncbi:MAG: delta-60 repeat domain-containing protein [Candidatus Eremiobacteraeota bacterium]|nr:delta-60 repeat domain-containing protein [Candidatus Eremiobacteraeota bacterium]
MKRMTMPFRFPLILLLALVILCLSFYFTGCGGGAGNAGGWAGGSSSGGKGSLRLELPFPRYQVTENVYARVTSSAGTKVEELLLRNVPSGVSSYVISACGNESAAPLLKSATITRPASGSIGSATLKSLPEGRSTLRVKAYTADGALVAESFTAGDYRGMVTVDLPFPGQGRFVKVSVRTRGGLFRSAGSLALRKCSAREREIPSEVAYYVISVSERGDTGPVLTPVRVDRPGDGASASVTLDEIPIGWKTVTIKAYNGNNGLVAEGSADAEILPGDAGPDITISLTPLVSPAPSQSPAASPSPSPDISPVPSPAPTASPSPVPTPSPDPPGPGPVPSPTPTTGDVTGTVTDAATSLPIVGVTVTIGTSSTSTAVDGTYSITGLSAGLHVISGQKNGYKNYSSSVSVAAGSTAVHDFSMDGLKILIGGNFNIYNATTRNFCAQVNPDGSLDTSFNPGTGSDTAIEALAVQSDGKIIIGGQFSTVNGVSRNRIARLNPDGTLDTSFDPGTGFSSTVWALAVQSDGKIVVGGNFVTYNGFPCNHIARLNTDGSRDTSFTPISGANNVVYTVALQSDGKIVIGGFFSDYDGTACWRIARVKTDGTLDTSFTSNPGADSLVNSLVVQSDGKIVIGGGFSNYDGVARQRVARANSDGTIDTAFNSSSGASFNVEMLAVQSDGKVFICGQFTSYGGTPRNYIARVNADGSLDTSFNPGTGANVPVLSMALQSDGKILIGGQFASYNGTLRNYIARVNADGSLDTSFNPGTGTNGNVTAIILQAP